MNPLEKCPEWFANGKFYVKSPDSEWYPHYRPDKIFKFTPARLQAIKSRRTIFTPNNCTLIARRVNSMTIEELKFIFPNIEPEDHKPDYIDLVVRMCSNNTINRDWTHHLLGCGIFPFGPEAFYKNIIINKADIHGR